MIMKTIERRYEIVKKELEFLDIMEFDADDKEQIMECKEKDPHHKLLLYIVDNGETISITPSDADVYFFVLNNEKNMETIEKVLEDIQKFIDDGSLSEI